MRLEDELFQSGLASFQAGKLNDAERDFKKILRRQPAHVGALNLLSIVLTSLERFSEAERYVKSALQHNSQSDATFYNYGIILKALSRPSEALARFDQALAINPAVAETWNNRGTVLNELNRYDEAVTSFDKALSLRPDLSEALFNKANALLALKSNDAALAAYDRVIAQKPRFAEAWIGRGKALYELERYDEALAAYNEACGLDRKLAAAWRGRGNVYFKLARSADALAAYDEVLALKPDDAAAWLDRASALFECRRHDEALAAYDRALALDPGNEEAWLDRANTLFALNRDDECVACIDKAIGLKDDFPEAYFSKGMVLLSLGRFEEGWPLYESRLKSRLIPLSAEAADDRRSILNTQSQIKDKNVAVVAEQGVGDEIMFASMLPDVIRDAKSVTYQIDARLLRLFSKAFPTVKFVTRTQPQPFSSQEYDTLIMAGSLGYVYRPAAASFPRTSYLAADPNIVARWRSALPAHGDRLRVGFSWRGGTVKTRRDQRSLVLEQLRPILTRDDCTFVSLQYGDVSEEIEAFNATLDNKIIHFPKDSIDDFEDLAGLIGALDIVVSVQNATVHLCGALGKPCLAMLPWKPEWRYGKYGSQMPWYSSVELLRQSQSGDWDTVLAAVETRLSSEIARKQSA